MTRRLSHRALALTLAATTTLFLIPAPAWSDESARLTGRVFQVDGTTPGSDVVVNLFDPATERSYASRPTGTDGVFAIDGAPAGTYQVVAETPEGAFLAADEVQLAAGSNRPVRLTLIETAPAYYQTGGKKMKRLHKWFIFGGVALAGLFVIDEVSEDADEDDSSPS